MHFFLLAIHPGSAVLTSSSGGEKYAAILDPQVMTQSFVNIGASLKDYMCAVLGVQSRQDVSLELTDRPLGESTVVLEVVIWQSVLMKIGSEVYIIVWLIECHGFNNSHCNVCFNFTNPLF